MFTQLLFRKAPSSLTDIAPLALRFGLGVIFMMHGYAKITTADVGKVAGMLGGIGFPAPELFAYLLMYGELIGGMFLIIGFLTYWVTLFDIVVALVAGIFVHLPKGFSASANGYEYVMLIGVAALSLFITGPGKYSVDAHLTQTEESPEEIPAE